MAIAPCSSRRRQSSFRSPPETKARSPPPRSTSTETSAASDLVERLPSSCHRRGADGVARPAGGRSSARRPALHARRHIAHAIHDMIGMAMSEIDDPTDPASRSSPSTGPATPGRSSASAPGQLPVHPRQLRERLPRQAVDLPPVLGLRHRRGVQPALPLPARPGRHRAVGRARPAHPVRLRLRRPRGRARRSAGSASRSTRSPTPRSCSTASRWTRSAPASRSTAPPRSCWRSTSPPPRRRACRARSSPAPSRTTSSRSTPRAAPGSGRRSRRCG